MSETHVPTTEVVAELIAAFDHENYGLKDVELGDVWLDELAEHLVQGLGLDTTRKMKRVTLMPRVFALDVDDTCPECGVMMRTVSTVTENGRYSPRLLCDNEECGLDRIDITVTESPVWVA